MVDYEYYSCAGGLLMMILGLIAVIVVFMLCKWKYDREESTAHIVLGINLLVFYVLAALVWFCSCLCV